LDGASQFVAGGFNGPHCLGFALAKLATLADSAPCHDKDVTDLWRHKCIYTPILETEGVS
jgi:hypothetical protein